MCKIRPVSQILDPRCVTSTKHKSKQRSCQLKSQGGYVIVCIATVFILTTLSINHSYIISKYHDDDDDDN
jgi:hypothetical protein